MVNFRKYTLIMKQLVEISHFLNSKKNWIISVIVTTVIGIFYFNQNIYMLISHNDFSEYFHRAEHWAEGNFLWEGGSDKLLSIIEYIAIKISNSNDFIDIYDNINHLIIILTLISIYLFLTTKNSFSLPFLVRVFSVLFFCSLPYVIINANTPDQTYLFGIMLLMWLAVYHILLLSSIVAFLVTLARPEGIIIIPFFILILWLDKNNRNKIAFNFSLFLLLFVAYKLFDFFYMPHAYGETELLERNYKRYLQTDIFDLLKSILIGLILLLINYFLLALIILKSYTYFLFFTIGTIVCLKEKKYYPYIAIPALYLIMIFILSRGFVNQDFSTIKAYLLSNVEWMVPYNFIHSYFSEYKILLDRILETHASNFPIAHQGRYVLFLYPFISIFVVVGVIFVAEKIFSLIRTNNKLKQYAILLTIIIILCSFLVPNTLKYVSIKDKFHLDMPTNHIVPLQQVAIILRNFRSRIDDSVLIYERCNSVSRKRYFASLMGHFTAFSGITNIYVKVCNKGSAVVRGIQLKNRLGGAVPGTYVFEGKKELSFINESLNFKFENKIVNYKYNKTKSDKINRLFKKPSLDIYRDLSIDFVIHDSKTFLNSSVRANLKLLTTFENYKIYAVPK